MTEDRERGSAGGVDARPTPAQAAYLRRGLVEPGGKLPLFDHQGQRYKARTIRSCIAQGWAEPWFRNPTKPDWLVCRLTDAGRAALAEWEKSETLVALPGHDRPTKARAQATEVA